MLKLNTKRSTLKTAVAITLTLMLAVVACKGGGGGSGDDDVTERNIGNDTEFVGGQGQTPDFIITQQAFIVAETTTLLRLALISNSAGANVKLALYQDDGTAGAPGTLIAETASTNIAASGVLEIPVVTEVTLAPGNYYISAVYDGAINIGRRFSPGNAGYFVAHTFADALPDPFGTPGLNNDQSFNYYMVVGD